MKQKMLQVLIKSLLKQIGNRKASKDPAVFAAQCSTIIEALRMLHEEPPDQRAIMEMKDILSRVNILETKSQVN